MLSLKPSQRYPGELDVYVKGKNLCSTYREKRKLLNRIPPKFRIKEIGAMKACDFPENFLFDWVEFNLWNKYLSVFEIERKGNQLKLSVYGFFGFDEQRLWLFWNPNKLRREMAVVAKKEGFRAKAMDDSGFGISYIFKTDGTIGELFQKALKETARIQRKAEKKLLKQATARLR